MFSKILFKCDRKKCSNCSYPTCELTTDVAHAINFVRMADSYVELCPSTWDYSQTEAENAERISESEF